MKLKSIPAVASYFRVTEMTIHNWRKKVALEKSPSGYYEDLLEWKTEVNKYYVQEPRNTRVDTTLGIEPVPGTTKPPSPDDDDDDGSGIEDEDIARQFAKARLREKEAKANLAELAIEEKKGLVVDLDDVVSVVADFAGALKAGLTKLDGTLAQSVSGVSSLEAQKRIREAVNHELDTLGEGAWLGAKKSQAAFRRLLKKMSDLLPTLPRGNGENDIASTQ